MRTLLFAHTINGDSELSGLVDVSQNPPQPFCFCDKETAEEILEWYKSHQYREFMEKFRESEKKKFPSVFDGTKTDSVYQDEVGQMPEIHTCGRTMSEIFGPNASPEEFAEMLSKEGMVFPAPKTNCEHDWQSVFYHDRVVGRYCPTCETLTQD